jgi:SUN domain-containing protein 1/2
VAALVTSAVDRLLADRTGLPDYASATAGGRVLAHSPLVSWAVPDSAASASHLHPRADELLLTAAFETPGHCLPLSGGGGAWVDVALREAVHVTAASPEHVPAAIAFDAASAPRRFELHALRDGGGEGALLVAGSYEARAGDEAAAPVQTFAAGASAAAGAVSRVRLALRSNHGGDYTCLYRLRVHGTPADAAATPHHAQS